MKIKDFVIGNHVNEHGDHVTVAEELSDIVAEKLPAEIKNLGLGFVIQFEPHEWTWVWKIHVGITGPDGQVLMSADMEGSPNMVPGMKAPYFSMKMESENSLWVTTVGLHTIHLKVEGSSPRQNSDIKEKVFMVTNT